jgi:hypothetical protein
MASQTISPDRPFERDRANWESLQKAIAVSSGFKRWQEEQEVNEISKVDLEERVRSYLRETLATLAY